MNPEDRRLIVAIGHAARTCAMYRELLDVARRYQDEAEVQRLRVGLEESDRRLATLITQALEDRDATEAGPGAMGDQPDES
jgi:hypothetical protein